MGALGSGVGEAWDLRGRGVGRRERQSGTAAATEVSFEARFCRCTWFLYLLMCLVLYLLMCFLHAAMRSICAAAPSRLAIIM